MEVIEKLPTGVESVLQRFCRTGGVISHLLIDAKGTDGTREDAHRQAAILTLEELQRRWRLLPFKYDSLSGKRLSVEQFLGPYFDDQSKRLFVRGNQRDFVNSYFRAGDMELRENIIFKAETCPQRDGYAYAFTEPPHRMTASSAQLQLLFDDVVSNVLGGLLDGTIIYEWDADRIDSIYFDRGREWWGCFFWTLYRPDGYFVGITASTSD